MASPQLPRWFITGSSPNQLLARSISRSIRILSLIQTMDNSTRPAPLTHFMSERRHASSKYHLTPSGPPIIWWIVAFGLFLRLLIPTIGYAHVRSADIFLNPDTDTYILPAQSLVAAHRFYSNGQPEIIRTPGYPFILTIGLLIHHLNSTTILIQIFLSCATIYLVYLIAKLISPNELVALIAAALYAIEPLSILYCSQILTETLFTAVSTLWLYYFVKYLRYRRTSQLVLSAVVLAASVYVRPIGYFLPIFLGAGLIALALFASRGGVTQVFQAVAFVTVAMALLVPWQLRNEDEAHYSGFAGISAVNMYFYLAASVLAVQQHTPFFLEQHELGYLNDQIYFARHPQQKSWPLAARLAFIDSEAHHVLMENKVTYLRIHLSGVVRALFDSGATSYLIFFGLYKPGGGILGSFNDKSLTKSLYLLFRVKPLVFWMNALLFPLQLVYLLGAAVSICSRRILAPQFAAIFLVAIYYLLIAGGPAAVGRFKHPAMPAISILAGFGIVSVSSRLRRRQESIQWSSGNPQWVNYHENDTSRSLA